MRCLRALESGVPDEVKYALHHLVKISHERADKFRFDQFVNLADSLIHTICNASTVWYRHPGWEYNMTYDGCDRPNLLNELVGTDNLIQKINSYEPLHIDNFYSDQWCSVMSDVNQACLILRNMAMLEDNARYLSGMALVRDMMTIIFQLPKRAETVEIKYYALEVAEQLTKYWILGANSPLYISLIQTIENNIYDRGLIIAGLRALSRISMNLEVTNRLEGVPVGLLQHIYQWLLVEDEDLRGACLDFLYQYTAVTENIQYLMTALNTEALIEVLMQFLMLGAVRVPLHPEQEFNPPAPKPSINVDVLPKLAPSIIDQFCVIADLREQSTVW
jgi:chromatin structure-remodeling complex subunit RSC9